MKRLAVFLFCFAACSDEPDGVSKWNQIAFEGRGVPVQVVKVPGGDTLLRLGVNADNVGLQRFVDGAFVPIDPPPPMDTGGPVNVSPAGDIVFGLHLLTKGASSWQRFAPDGTTLEPVPTSDGTFVAQMANQVMLAQSNASPFEPLGEPIAKARVAFADGRGRVWIETETDELWRAGADGLYYMHGSSGLASVGADGTLYYLSVGDDERLYGTLYARAVDGAERVRTRGRCKAGPHEECPNDIASDGGYHKNFALGGGGRIYWQWYDDLATGGRMLMRLDPGSSTLVPAADTYEMYFLTGMNAADVTVTSDDQVWALVTAPAGGLADKHGLFKLGRSGAE